MIASVLKQNPNTKIFKRTLIYFDTDTQYVTFVWKSPLSSHKMKRQNKFNENKISFSVSFFIVFDRLSVV